MIAIAKRTKRTNGWDAKNVYFVTVGGDLVNDKDLSMVAKMLLDVYPESSFIVADDTVTIKKL